jgi:hypothetical protein
MNKYIGKVENAAPNAFKLTAVPYSSSEILSRPPNYRSLILPVDSAPLKCPRHRDENLEILAFRPVGDA